MSCHESKQNALCQPAALNQRNEYTKERELFFFEPPLGFRLLEPPLQIGSGSPGPAAPAQQALASRAERPDLGSETRGEGDGGGSEGAWSGKGKETQGGGVGVVFVQGSLKGTPSVLEVPGSLLEREGPFDQSFEL